MTPELLTGAVGLLGAALGALGAIWAGSVTAKSQRQQAREQLEATRLQWRLDNKRDVYLNLLGSASRWQSTTWEFFHALDRDADDGEKLALYRRKVERWQEFAVASTTAKVFTADTHVQAASDGLQDALLAVERVCDDWYHGRGNQDRESHTAAFRRGSRACESAMSGLASMIELSLDFTADSRQT
ncbi:hypothetical protein ACGFYZ_31795 [Streptomyces sp. NPDC048330]|uniref:hypothetical protein n=1 Tax=Streptomyces sp. NPDC048330 TaxID=3365533 RepID=UPI0037143458